MSHGWVGAAVLAACMATGCMSPYHGDRGALFGGLAGAGVGTAIGDAVGNEGAGALIGAGVGALTGAAIGNGLDEVEARNRAEIAAQLGRQLPPGTVTLADVVSMSRAGIDEELIATHVRNNGLSQPLRTGDLIMLQNEGVSKRVIAEMQTPRQAAAPGGVIVPGGPPPVVVSPYYYPPPPCYWGPPPPYVYYGFGGCRPRRHFGWGMSFGGPL